MSGVRLRNHWVGSGMKEQYPPFDALKDDDRSGREGAAEGLAEMKEKAIDPLIKSLKNPDWHVRMGVLISLRIIGDKRLSPGSLRP